jgi:thymidylate synthase (FAD)
MKVIPPSHKILFMPERKAILGLIERIGRTCYKSEDKITADSAADFVQRLIRSGHHSVIEHTNLTVHFLCDRGVSHELVRHRLASFSQESTRYANYSKERFGGGITVIRPFFWAADSSLYAAWLNAMGQAEKAYLDLLKMGARPEEARAVLPTSLKTEVVMTCNVREWRHVLDLRCSKASHPQMREVVLPLLDDFHEKIPVIFDDLYAKYQREIKECLDRTI